MQLSDSLYVPREVAASVKHAPSALAVDLLLSPGSGANAIILSAIFHSGNDSEVAKAVELAGPREEMHIFDSSMLTESGELEGVSSFGDAAYLSSGSTTLSAVAEHARSAETSAMASLLQNTLGLDLKVSASNWLPATVAGMAIELHDSDQSFPLLSVGGYGFDLLALLIHMSAAKKSSISIAGEGSQSLTLIANTSSTWLLASVFRSLTFATCRDASGSYHSIIQQRKGGNELTLFSISKTEGTGALVSASEKTGSWWQWDSDSHYDLDNPYQRYMNWGAISVLGSIVDNKRSLRSKEADEGVTDGSFTMTAEPGPSYVGVNDDNMDSALYEDVIVPSYDRYGSNHDRLAVYLATNSQRGYYDRFFTSPDDVEVLAGMATLTSLVCAIGGLATAAIGSTSSIASIARSSGSSVAALDSWASELLLHHASLLKDEYAIDFSTSQFGWASIWSLLYRAAHSEIENTTSNSALALSDTDELTFLSDASALSITVDNTPRPAFAEPASVIVDAESRSQSLEVSGGSSLKQSHYEAPWYASHDYYVSLDSTDRGMGAVASSEAVSIFGGVLLTYQDVDIVLANGLVVSNRRRSGVRAPFSLKGSWVAQGSLKAIRAELVTFRAATLEPQQHTGKRGETDVGSLVVIHRR